MMNHKYITSWSPFRGQPQKVVDLDFIENILNTKPRFVGVTIENTDTHETLGWIEFGRIPNSKAFDVRVIYFADKEGKNDSKVFFLKGVPDVSMKIVEDTFFTKDFRIQDIVTASGVERRIFSQKTGVLLNQKTYEHNESVVPTFTFSYTDPVPLFLEMKNYDIEKTPFGNFDAVPSLDE